MTTETKSYIDFADIVGIELECPQCQATITHTLEKFSNLSYQCPNCRAQIVARGETNDETLGMFVNWLKLAQRLKTASRIRLHVRQGS